jgi:hypothetical protein
VLCWPRLPFVGAEFLGPPQCTSTPQKGIGLLLAQKVRLTVKEDSGLQADCHQVCGQHSSHSRALQLWLLSTHVTLMTSQAALLHSCFPLRYKCHCSRTQHHSLVVFTHDAEAAAAAAVQASVVAAAAA